MKFQAGKPIDPEKWEWPDFESWPEDPAPFLDWIAYAIMGIMAAGLLLIGVLLVLL